MSFFLAKIVSIISKNNGFILFVNFNNVYNNLNLPNGISINGSGGNGTISYIYDATGTKLRKKVVETGKPDRYIYYAGNYVYEGSSLKYFSQPEGYVDTENGYGYVYQYKDHLGNIRLSYKNVSLTGTPSLQIAEENNYYPIGLQHKGYNNVVNGADHPYGFQEQEEQNELGLNWLSYKYRNYDPATARFFNIDPLTEDHMDWAPYVFSGNRVIDARELEGLEPFFVNYDMSFKDNVMTNVNAYSQAAQSISQTAQFIINPVETVKGVWNIGKALFSPIETGKAIVNNVFQTIADTQSTNPDVAGPALGKIMAFTAETAVGVELAKVGTLGKLDGVTNQLQNTANKASSIVGEGSGAVHGTRVHTQFGNMAETISGVTKEVSYLNGNVVKYGTKGSVRADAMPYMVL